MNRTTLFRLLAATVAVPLALASCSTSTVPDSASAGVANHADGSVTFQGATYTPEQVRARAAQIDAQFAADLQVQLAALKTEAAGSAGLRAQAEFPYPVVSKPVNINLTTGYTDDCFYLTVGVMKVNVSKGLGNAQTISANSTKVMWWRIKGYATLNTTVSNDELTDLASTCYSANAFFGGSRQETGNSQFRIWEPPTTTSEANAFQWTITPNYGVMRNGDTDYISQGYTRAVSYKRGERALGTAPAYWSRTY